MSVIYGPNTGPSARALAEGLDTTAVRWRREYDLYSDNSINWTGHSIERIINGNTETNKYNQLERFAHAGLACVPHSQSWFESWLPRTNYHWGGRDFTRNTRPEFYTQPIDGVKEWRLHVFRKPGGRRGMPGDYAVQRVGWKVNAQPSLNVNVYGVEIRNRRTGWRLQHYAQPRAIAARDTLSKWAIAILGWDFGCVDMLQTEGPERWVLLEANSCPALKEMATLACYKRNVGALLNT